MPNPTEETVPPAAAPGHGSPVLQDVLPLEYSTDAGRATRYRWVILALVFFAITINYVDRMVMGLLSSDLRARFHITADQYGNITMAFGLSYAFGQMMSGRWLDWVGTRVGYAIALAAWSVAAMLHALVGSAFGFGLARALLGVTESPAYPAATKTLAEWFPKKERALAMGFVNAGGNVGAVLAMVMVPWLAIEFGWQSAFVASGAMGLIWIAFWLPLYRRPHEHPRVNAAELAHINGDPPEPTGKIRWATLLGYRQTWAFALSKFLTDSVWSFYLFWLPWFLEDRHGVKLDKVAMPMILAYLIADVGSIAGGWLSSHLIKRGWSVNAARKVSLFACAIVVLPAVFAPLVANMWTAVVLCGVGLAAHQGFSSNLYTLVSDTFPKRAVGSVAGLGGTFGYVGTTLFMKLVGLIVTWTNKNYLPIFIIAVSAYMVSFLIIHLLMPRLEPADVGEDPGHGFPVLPPTSPSR